MGGVAGGGLDRVVDPRGMVTAAEYEDALVQRDRLGKLIPRLKVELLKLKGLRKGRWKYAQEFETIRAEAVRGALRSVGLMGSMVGRLAEEERYKAVLTPKLMDKLNVALNAMKAGVSYEHAALTGEEKEKRKLQLETIDSAAEMLLAASVSGLGHEAGSRLLLEQMGKVLQGYNKTSRYLMDPETGTRPTVEEYGEMAKLGIGVAAVFAAPVAIGVGVESLGERGL